MRCIAHGAPSAGIGDPAAAQDPSGSPRGWSLSRAAIDTMMGSHSVPEEAEAHGARDFDASVRLTRRRGVFGFPAERPQPLSQILAEVGIRWR